MNQSSSLKPNNRSPSQKITHFYKTPVFSTLLERGLILKQSNENSVSILRV